MYGAESIGDKNLSHVCKCFGKFGIILRLALSKTEILEKKDLAGLKSFCLCLCIGTDGIGSENNFLAEELAQSLCYGSQRKLTEGLLPAFLSNLFRLLSFFDLLFHKAVKGSDRLSQVGAGNNSCTVVKKLLNGGDGCLDALITGNFSSHLVLRNIEIAAKKNLFAAYINVVNGFLVVVHLHILHNKI